MISFLSSISVDLSCYGLPLALLFLPEVLTTAFLCYSERQTTGSPLHFLFLFLFFFVSAFHNTGFLSGFVHDIARGFPPGHLASMRTAPWDPCCYQPLETHKILTFMDDTRPQQPLCDIGY